MTLQVILWLALPLALAYAVWEARRWRTPPMSEMISARQRRIRAWGLAFLLLTLALWLRGTYLPLPRTPARTRAQKLAVLHYLEHWTLTALCALPLLPLALLDSRENLRRLREERAGLVQEYIAGTPAAPDSPASSEPRPKCPAISGRIGWGKTPAFCWPQGTVCSKTSSRQLNRWKAGSST